MKARWDTEAEFTLAADDVDLADSGNIVDVVRRVHRLELVAREVAVDVAALVTELRRRRRRRQQDDARILEQIGNGQRHVGAVGPDDRRNPHVDELLRYLQADLRVALGVAHDHLEGNAGAALRDVDATGGVDLSHRHLNAVPYGVAVGSC